MAGMRSIVLCLRSLKNSPTNIPNVTVCRNASFKAAQIVKLNEPLVINELKVRKLKKEEVRIGVQHCSVNMSDLLVHRGEFDITPTFPFTPGFEASGEIIEVGSEAAKKGFAVGNRVVTLNKEKFECLAEQVVVNVDDVWKIPSSMKFKEAAALINCHSTALIGLSRRGHVKEGDTVLVTATAAGLGLSAVDVAANVYRAQVIAICDNEKQADQMREYGAFASFADHPKDTVKKVLEVTKKKGARIVFDTVGGRPFETASKCVALEGKIIMAGFAIRHIPEIEDASKRPHTFSLVGVSLRSYRATDIDVYRGVVEDALDMCEQGLIRPMISKKVSLSDVNEAFKYLQEKESVGKVVVKVKDD